MDLDRLNRWRSLVGKAAAMCCVVFFLSVLDGVVSHFGQSPNDVRLLPGASVSINGPARDNIREIEELEYVTTSDHLNVLFERVHTGYWMGGRMWRGVLTASPTIVPGGYSITVRSKNEPAEQPITVFRVMIYQDAAGLQQSSASVIERNSGWSPWYPAALFFGLAALLFGAVYLLSTKREQLMRQEGKAEIYRITKQDDGYEVSFGLGINNGLQIGSSLRLLDEDGVPVGTVVVKEVLENDAIAMTAPEYSVRPGYMVSLLT
jgi:hypothetical protein